jgi:hypothetical protein
MPPSPLEDVAALIRAGAESGDPAAARAAEGLAAWLAGNDCLENALGAAPGARSARRQRGRDEALRRLAKLAPAASARAVAASVHRLVRRYEASAWPSDQAARHRPDDANGDAYDILQHGDLPGEDRLRRLLKSVGY